MRKRSFPKLRSPVSGGSAILPLLPSPQTLAASRVPVTRRGPVGAHLPPAGCAERHLAPSAGQHRGSTPATRPQVRFPQPRPRGPSRSSRLPVDSWPQHPRERRAFLQTISHPSICQNSSSCSPWTLAPLPASSSLASSFSPALSRHLLQEALRHLSILKQAQGDRHTFCLPQPVTPLFFALHGPHLPSVTLNSVTLLADNCPSPFRFAGEQPRPERKMVWSPCGFCAPKV